MTILPVVLFDDIELWATGKLRAALLARTEPYTDNVLVSNKIPNDPVTGEPKRRDRMVIVRRDGGPRLDVVREVARLGINVWGETDQIATDLARMTAALLWSSPDGDPVSKVTQTLGPSSVPDESKQPRLYMTFELISKGRNA